MSESDTLMRSARTHDNAYRYEHNLQRLIDQFKTDSDARTLAKEELRASLLRDRCVMLVGSAGMGKLEVAESVARSLSPSQVVHFRCGSGEDDVRLRTLKSLDDAAVAIISTTHLLGTAGLKALRELVTNGGPRVIVTLCTGRLFAPSDAGSAERSALWVSTGLKRIELPGLGVADAYPLVIAEGKALKVEVPFSAFAQILVGAHGNPLLLKELTREFCLSNPGASLHDFFFTTRSPSRRLVDILYPHVAGLSRDEAFALTALARLGEVSHARAARLVGLRSVRMLSRHGLLELTGSGERVRANMTYAAIVEQRRPLQVGQLVERLISELRSGQRLNDNEHFVVALHWAHNPGRPARVTSSEASEVYTRAAHRANVLGYAELSEDFAGRAFALHPTVPLATMRARGLASQGDFAAACAALDDERLRHESAAEDAELLFCRLSIAAVAPASGSVADVLASARTWGTLDDLLDHTVTFFEYLMRTDAHVSPEDIAALENLAGNQRLPASVRLSALTSLLSAYTYAGDGTQLTNTIIRGRAIVGELWFGDRPKLARNLEKLAGVFTTQAGFIEAFTGVYRGELEVKMMSLGIHAARIGDQFSLGLLDIVSGYLLFTLGNQDGALASLERGIPIAGTAVNHRWNVTARSLLSGALALAGRVDEAETMLRSFTVGNTGLLSGFEECSVRMIILQRRGDLEGAKALALATANQYSDRSWAIAVAIIYAGFQLGVPAEELLPALDEVSARRGSLPALNAAEDHIRASAARDPHALRRVGKQFSALRLAREASDAYHEAHTLHLQRGEAAEARECTILAGAAPTDATEAEAASDRTLTRREAEVALLASQGLTNLEIAKTLYLSVRTVESHILQARTKTGAASKRELAQTWTRYAPA